MERSGIEVFGSRKPVLDRLESGDDFRQCGIVGTKRVDCPENLTQRVVETVAQTGQIDGRARLDLNVFHPDVAQISSP